MSLCILTSNDALFPPAAFNGRQLIRFLPLMGENETGWTTDKDRLSQAFTQLESEFNSILLLTPSEEILPGAAAAKIAARSHGGTAKISVVDSRQIGPGLGILAQIAAQKAAAGASLLQVEDHIRAVTPHLFTLLCPDIHPPYTTGLNNQPPVSDGDSAGSMQIFSIEEGTFAMYKKIRTWRHLLEITQEFLEEFETPQQIIYFHGVNSGIHSRQLRETAGGLFPGIRFSDLNINFPMAAFFGPQTVGITVLEMPGQKPSFLQEHEAKVAAFHQSTGL